MLSLEETALAVILVGSATAIATSFAMAATPVDSRTRRFLFAVFLAAEAVALGGFALLASVGVSA